MNPWNYWVYLTIFTLVACITPAKKSTESAVRSLSYWGNWKSTPLEERIIPASDALVDFVRQDNIKNEIPHSPYRPPFDQALRSDIQEAVASMPKNVRNLVQSKLAAIVPIGDLGSTGYSDIIRDERGHAAAGFIILDVKSIDRKANDWATWKENSPFAHDGSITLKAFIAEQAHDTRIATIQYILLHEIGHILAIGNDFHPPWDEQPVSTDALKPYPFASVSWKISDQKFQYEILGKEGGFDCNPVHYYSKNPELYRSKAEACYRSLERTGFVSLYASTNPFDDFAETFAFYVHRVLLKNPWFLEIGTSAKIYRYEPDWTEKRFERKRQIVEAFLSE